MLLRKPIHYFVFGNFLIAFSATALTHLSLHKDEIDIDDVHLLIFVFFSTLFAYNLNLHEGMKGMKSSAFRSVRHNWIMKHEKFVWVFTILALVISSVEFFMLKKDTLIFLLVPGLFAVGYAVPVKIPGSKTLRLRDLPFIKIFLVAWVWGTFTVGLPVVQHSGLAELLQLKNFLLFFSRAVFIFAITIPFDIRDMAYDSDKDVNTIPSRLGIEKSKYLSLFLLLIFIMIELIRFYLYLSSSSEWVALTLAGVATAMLVNAINSSRKELFYSFWMEGTMLLQWIAVMLSCFIS